MPVIAAIEVQLAAGDALTPDSVGGIRAIAAEADSLVAAPYLDVLVLLAESVNDEEEEKIIDDVVLRGFLEGSNPLCLRDAANRVISSKKLLARLGRRLERILEQRVNERKDGQAALIAAYSLEALFRLALIGVANKYRVLTLLTDVGADEEGLFVEHAAKLIGAAFHVWRDDNLLVTLEHLRSNSDAEEEAAFELGLSLLSQAFASESSFDILNRLDNARVILAQALDAGENRSDALAYCAVIDLINCFASGADAEEMEAPLEKLVAAVADRAHLLRGFELPEWLRPRTDREAQWMRLARTATKVAKELERPSWLNAWAVMEQLLDVYDADRTLAIGTGLNNLLRPRIERKFARERGLLAHLDDLLQDQVWTGAHKQISTTLRARIAELVQESSSAIKAEEDALYPLLGRVLKDDQLIATLLPDRATQLEQALASRERQHKYVGNPVVQRVLENIRESLSLATDYRQDVRLDFDELILQIAMFCKDRSDASRKELGKRGAYLYSKVATEFDLQADLREWLVGNYLRAEVHSEVEGVAAGRSDLYITFGKHRFVIELKRHFGAVSRGSARHYLNQTAAYQGTNVKLGMLGILELASKSGPMRSIEESIWYESLVPEGSHVARHVVVFSVPGMRVLPSQM